MKDIGSSSIVIQWDVVDDFLPTSYTVVWTDESDDIQVATTIALSYTITGLTFDAVYTISVVAANMCGSGPEFSTTTRIHGRYNSHRISTSSNNSSNGRSSGSSICGK